MYYHRSCLTSSTEGRYNTYIVLDVVWQCYFSTVYPSEVDSYWGVNINRIWHSIFSRPVESYDDTMNFKLFGSGVYTWSNCIYIYSEVKCSLVKRNDVAFDNLLLTFPAVTNIIWTLSCVPPLSSEQIIELLFCWDVKLLVERVESNGIFVTSEMLRVTEFTVSIVVVIGPRTWSVSIGRGDCCEVNLILHLIRVAFVLQFTVSDPPGHTYSIPVGSRFSDGVAEKTIIINNMHAVKQNFRPSLYLECHMYGSIEESTLSRLSLQIWASFELAP